MSPSSENRSCSISVLVFRWYAVPVLALPWNSKLSIAIMRSQLIVKVSVIGKRCLNVTRIFCEILSDVDKMLCHRGSDTGIEKSIGTYEISHSTLISKNYNFDCCTHAAIHLNGMLMEMGRVCVHRWQKWRCTLSATHFSLSHKNRCFFQPNEKYLHVATNQLLSTRKPRAQFNMKLHILSIQIIKRIRQGKKTCKKRVMFRFSKKKKK